MSPTSFRSPPTPRPIRSTSRPEELLRWPQWLWPLSLLPLLILALSALVPPQRQLLLLGAEDQAVLSRPFRLEQGWLGSGRIDLRTELPPDSAMALAVELLDARGAVQLQLTQDGWRETGTWVEDGESGTYDESQSELQLPLRPQRSGDYRLRLVLEDFSDDAQPQRPPLLRLHLAVHNHRVDAGLLLFTALISALLLRLHVLAETRHCRRRWWRRSDDDRHSLRLEAGGAGLLRLRLRGRYEKPDRVTAPLVETHLQVPLRLRLSDAWGTTLLEHQETVRLQSRGSADAAWWLAEASVHVRLPERTELGIWARLPERPASAALEMEWLELVVEDGVRTPRPVPVFALNSTTTGAAAASSR